MGNRASISSFAAALCVVATTVAAPTARAEEPIRRVGWTLDVGLPDVAQLGVVFRPARPLHVSLTGGTNGFGVGGRAQLTLKVPWDVGPALSVEAGGFVPSDARYLLGEKTNLPVLQSVGWIWGSAHAGLEFGDPKATFFLYGGMTEMRMNVSGVDAFVDQQLENDTLDVEDLRVTARFPSARIGVKFWFRARSE